MSYGLSLLLLAGTTLTNAEAAESAAHFDNYTKAYRFAQEVDRPLLVILNPGQDSEGGPIQLASVRKTEHRRELLENYVVCVLDTETEHGKTCHALFKSTQLPHVVVIDKEQKYKIFQTSESLYGQRWTEILETYRTGELVRRRATSSY